MKLRHKWIFLLSAVLLSAAALLPRTVSAAVRINTYENGTDSHSAVQIMPGESVGFQFHARTSFDMISAVCPSYGNRIGDMRLSLFRWDQDYYTTISGKAAVTKLYTNFSDNQELSLTFSPLPAGEYLFLLHDTRESVGLWTTQKGAANTRLIKNGAVLPAGMQGSIRFVNQVSSYFGAISDLIDTAKPVTPPPKAELPADSAIVQMDVRPDTWSAVDGLNRTVSDYEAVGQTKEKYVGMFYWTWHAGHSVSNRARNVTSVLKKYPEAVNDFNHAAWEGTPSGTPYFWNEPLFGYYNGMDAYVLRKHAEMLADAGVDVVIFDCTNGTFTWKAGYEKLLEVFAKARADGVKTPQIAFMLNFAANSDSKANLNTLYLDLYRPKRYQDLWFYWEGKPLIMAHKSNLNASDPIEKEILNFFTFRANEPTYYAADTPSSQKRWGWCSIYPQTKYGTDSTGRIEQMTVSVAQNYSASHGLTAMNDPRGGVFGRSYTSGKNGAYSYQYTHQNKTVTVSSQTENALLYGLNFQQQWDYAIQCNPDFIFVTGWNEWVAGRHAAWQGTVNAFPDQFNDEYSRDIEPSSGILKDHYYYQLVENIRRYKGVSVPQKNDADAIIDIYETGDMWSGIFPSYNHYTGSTLPRDTDGYVGTHYKSDTMRNDIVSAKVAFDRDYVYFMVETADPLSPYTDKAWMRLFLDTDFTGSTPNWEGFEYVINRKTPGAETAYLEKSTGGWNFRQIGTVAYHASGNRLQIKVPRTLLGFGTDGNIPAFRFKWADHMQEDGNILDFYQSGDVAPGGRFTFVFDPSGAEFDPKVPPVLNRPSPAPTTAPVKTPAATPAKSSVPSASFHTPAASPDRASPAPTTHTSSSGNSISPTAGSEAISPQVSPTSGQHTEHTSAARLSDSPSPTQKPLKNKHLFPILLACGCAVLIAGGVLAVWYYLKKKKNE